MRRKGRTKQIPVLTASLFLAAALAACGARVPEAGGETTETSAENTAKEAEEINSGRAEELTAKETAAAEPGNYQLFEMTYEGETFDNDFLESIGMEPYTMVLLADGTGWLKIDEKVDLSWKDGVITVGEFDATYTYELTGDRITLTEDGGDTITFEKVDSLPEETTGTEEIEEVEAPDTGVTTEGDTGTAYQRCWNGDWYGWGSFTDGTGMYEDLDASIDCMARIEIQEDGTGSLILWDEMTDLSWPLAEAEVEIPESGFDPGRLRSVSGRYLDTDLGSGDWVIAPDDLGYKGLICILGTYEDPEYAGSTYAYKFILRPWGTDWSDVAEEYPDSLPYYYETWYLPAIEAGIPMPDVIGGGDFSAPGEVPDEEMEGQG